MFTLKETGERLSHRAAQNMLGISFPRDSPPPELEVYVAPVVPPSEALPNPGLPQLSSPCLTRRHENGGMTAS